MPSTPLEELRAAGWHVEVASEPVRLPVDIESRYPDIPPDLRHLLVSLARCSNPDDTAWLLCAPELTGTSGSAFAWNECELMSLSGVAGDSTEEAKVRGYWNDHFPFLLSVKSGYAYFAVSLSGATKGRVVHGCEPEFEESSVVADSFAQFLDAVVAVARGDRTNGILVATI